MDLLSRGLRRLFRMRMLRPHRRRLFRPAHAGLVTLIHAVCLADLMPAERPPRRENRQAPPKKP